jgi:hypothetical protein
MGPRRYGRPTKFPPIIPLIPTVQRSLLPISFATFSRPLAWLCLVIFSPAVSSIASAAHPISISTAIVEVSEKRIRVEMQIMLEDLVLYHSLSANEHMQYSVNDLQEAAKKHRKFVTDYFSILNEDGQRLKGQIEEEVFEQIGEQPVPQADLMQRSISFLLVYDLEKEKPEYLTFLQIFGGLKSALPSVMDLHIARNEQYEDAAQIGHNRPHTIKLDWKQNPDGKKISLSELKQKRKQQFRDRLGIRSYSGLYSFLYINRFEVRHEILIPLLTLEQFVPIQRADPEFLEVAEQEAARESIGKFFKEHGKFAINGQQADPAIQRISFFSLDIADFALNADARRINMAQGRAGIIISYPSDSVPATVDVEWDTFSQYAQFIDMTLLIGNQSPDRNYFHAEAKTYQWKGELVGPVVSPIKATANLSVESERTEVSEKLLSNIYRAFDYRKDEDVYDSLSSSVQGSLLRELYLRIKRSLVLAEQGGELSHATEVKVTSSVAGKASNTYETTWTVTAVSEHWGHIHTRTTEYRADLTITKNDDNWKLEKFQLFDEKRIRFDTSIRGNDSTK